MFAKKLKAPKDFPYLKTFLDKKKHQEFEKKVIDGKNLKVKKLKDFAKKLKGFEKKPQPTRVFIILDPPKKREKKPAKCFKHCAIAPFESFFKEPVGGMGHCYSK